MYHDTIILDFSNELSSFRGVVCELDMPTVDMDSAMQVIIDSLGNLKRSGHDLNLAAFYMSEGEGLFENSELEEDAQKRVFKAVIKIGKEIKNKLIQLNAYRNGEFPYKYRSMTNDSTIVLRKDFTEHEEYSG